MWRVTPRPTVRQQEIDVPLNTFDNQLGACHIAADCFMRSETNNKSHR